MSKSCIMSPLYHRDLDIGANFIRQYNKHFDDDNLWLIFSDKQETFDMYEKVRDGNLKYNAAVCTEKLDVSKKPISQKKIWGAKEVFSNTDCKYVGVVDIDSLFVAHKDLDKLFEERVNRKIVYASRSTNHSIINNVGRDMAQRFFNKEDVEKLDKITHGFTQYFWFNDVPIYERETFYEWLKYIDYENKKDRLLYTTFDYMIYMYYLLVTEQWTLEVIPNAVTTDKGSFLETQHMQDKNNFKRVFEMMKPMWIKDPIEDESMPDVFMRVHVNR